MLQSLWDVLVCPKWQEAPAEPVRTAWTGAIGTTGPGTGLGQSTPLTIANAGFEHFPDSAQ